MQFPSEQGGSLSAAVMAYIEHEQTVYGCNLPWSQFCPVHPSLHRHWEQFLQFNGDSLWIYQGNLSMRVALSIMLMQEAILQPIHLSMGK